MPKHPFNRSTGIIQGNIFHTLTDIMVWRLLHLFEAFNIA